MTSKNEIEILDAASSPAKVIEYAMKKGEVSIAQLEQLLTLKERHEANEAKKAYHQAMADFKADPPKIKKDKKVSFAAGGGRTEYNHATLGNVTASINAGLSKCGLSASWTVQQVEKRIGVTTKITHKLGHSEETTLWAEADNSGSKNAIQQIGSTITYLERYGLLAMTGLATFDQDDDARGTAPVEIITDKELSHLRDLMADKEIPEDKMVKWLKIESLEQLPKGLYNKAVKAAEAKKKPGSK